MVTTWNQSRQPPHKHDTRHALPTSTTTPLVFSYTYLLPPTPPNLPLSLFFLSFSVSWFSPLPSFSYFLLSTPSARGASGLSLFINSSSSHLHFLFFVVVSCLLPEEARRVRIPAYKSLNLTLAPVLRALDHRPTDRQFNSTPPSFSVSLRKTKLNNLPNSAC